MTAATLSPNIPTAVASRPHRAKGLAFGGVLRSEWIKMWSLRSTAWSLGVAVVLMTGTTALVAWGTSTQGASEGETIGNLVTPGVYFAHLVLAVLGALAITGEYSTGQIRSTLVSVPRRTPALAAKAVVLAAVAAFTTLVGVVLSVLVSMPWHDELDVTIDLSDGETLRILGGVPLFIAAIALFAFAIGALVRNSPGALGIVLGLMLVVENVIAAIPLAFFDRIEPFMPSTAGSRLISTQQTINDLNEASAGMDLSAWQGYGVLVAWVAVLMTLAAVLLRRRDA